MGLQRSPPPSLHPPFNPLTPHLVAREVARRMPCVISETPQFHPAYSSSSAARCSSTPTRESVVYSAEDNAAIEEWIKKTVQTTWHSLGTCRMGNTADGASVVDPQLRVWGTRRLMLADMSVAPGNVGANTNNTALLVGERAAVLAAEALGVVLAV